MEHRQKTGNREVLRNTKYIILTGVFALLFLLTGRLLQQPVEAYRSLKNTAARLQEGVTRRESAFREFVKLHPEIFDKSFQSLDQKTESLLSKQSFTFFVYHNDTLVLWTGKDALPTQAVYTAPSGMMAYKFKNGWFVYEKILSSSNHPGDFIIGLFPVKYSYEIKNKYLEDQFVTGHEVPPFIEISLKPDSLSIPINDAEGKSIFFVTENLLRQQYSTHWAILLAEILMILFSLIFIYEISCKLCDKIGFPAGLLCLVMLFLLFRFTLPIALLSQGLLSTDLFDPRFYASGSLSPSLGFLLLNLLLVALAGIFLFRQSGHSSVFLGPIRHWTFLIFAIAISFIFQYFIDIQIRKLLIDSVISYEINNFFTLDAMSLAGFMGIAMIMMAYFLTTFKMLDIAGRHWNRADWPVFVIALLGNALFIYLAPDESGDYFMVKPAIWTLGWICLIWFGLRRRNTLFSTPVIIVLVAAFAILSALYLDHYNHSKELLRAENLARKLSDDRDYVAEYAFTDVHCRITDDPFVKSSFGNPSLNRKLLLDRIKLLYFKGYLGRFDIDLHAFRPNGTAIVNEDTTHLSSFALKIREFGFETSDVFLYFIENPKGNFYYSSLVPVYSDTTQVGTLVIELKPRPYNPSNVYPELLLSKGIQRLDAAVDLNYAVYIDQILFRSKGAYAYGQANSFPFPDSVDQFLLRTDKLYDHLIYRASPGKIVVVSIAISTPIELVSQFSYLFSFIFVFVMVVYMIFLLYYLLMNLRTISLRKFTLTFRDRISLSLISILVFSFFAVGTITTWYFTVQYDLSHRDRLLRKEKDVNEEMSEILRNSLAESGIIDLKDFFAYQVPTIADNQAMDINIYDMSGQLLISSQPGIFEKNLVSNRMNPNAYWKLITGREPQVLQNESIGNLDFISVYAPLTNSIGQTIAYLNLPYFSKAQNLKEDISRFLVALVNVYVPLLLFTLIIGLFISNSITNPLTEIGQKLRKIRLGKKNEPIQWKRKDEIGLLVEEYNRMISKLEESAQSLAKSEREGAWREMARQIAHEIKNPLTPMKLSIQYLQRALKDDATDSKELTLRMANTLIEQIDNLSEIATAFSSFAHMPTSNNEVIDLDHYIRAVVDLFKDSEHHSINYHSQIHPAHIYADKSQMISVFNNLIKNATQAIPEDRHGVIEVILSEEYGNYKVVVMDNGKGIPEEIHSKVFVPNFTTKSSGTGLGLAISRQIIEGASGTITFESEVDKGTSFYVTLPKYIEPKSNGEEESIS